MDEDLNNAAEQPTNAVSLFGQGAGTNDFPVLKAFQEYIDAEQAKARKRMLGLSIFFVVLLMVVVATFAVILVLLVNSKQSLMDRLLDMAMKEKETAAVQQAPQNDATAKLNDRIAALQEKLAEQQLASERAAQKAREDQLKAEQERLRRETEQQLARERAAQKAREDQLKAEQDALKKAMADQKKAMEDQKKAMDKALASQQEKMEAERKRMQDERKKAEADRKKSETENSKEAERERFLRRQYPDYYAKVDAAKKRLAEKKAAKDDDGEAELEAEAKKIVDEQSAKLAAEQAMKTAKPVKSAPMKVRVAEAKTAEDLDSLRPIDYFTESVETIEVENGEDDVPFLINKPDAKKKK